jgi:hypothetical protein
MLGHVFSPATLLAVLKVAPKGDMSMPSRELAICTVVSMLAMPAASQDASSRFRFVGEPGNIQACVRLDAQLTRVHTIKVTGDHAEMTGPGGLHERLKRTRPDTYEATFELSGAQLQAVATLGGDIKAVALTSRSLGCRWHAQFE